MRLYNVLIAIALALGCVSAAQSAGTSIIVQSTTSTKNSGLYDHILPLFKADTGITAHVVAVGTGQALRNARNCDGDVLLVHAEEDELKFINEGYGEIRNNLMYNDFVIIGPAEDPADIINYESVDRALTRIAEQNISFVSRGDDSGTHKKERMLWRRIGLNPTAYSGEWYLETGQGMGATINVAVESGAYVLSDRATWLTFNKQETHIIAVQGDKEMFNQYGVIRISEKRCPSVRAEAADAFVDWLLSEKGQSAIGEYIVSDQQLFFPNAGS